MTQLILLLASIYAIVVGFRGNGRAMLTQAGSDVKGYAPWALAIVLLGILAVNQYTEELGKPFAALFALAVIIKRWSSIQATSVAFYKEVTS